MSNYYLAPSLVKLRSEINKHFPNRDSTSDGWIGDTSHQARPSDHNPDWAHGGVVRAIDVDIDDGDTGRDLRLMLIREAKRDPRTYYVISNGYIYSRTYGFAKRKYTGSNGHFSHVHLSIRSGDQYEKSRKAWFGLEVVDLSNVRKQAQEPTRKLISVKRIQRALNAKMDAGLTVDGDFGNNTKKAYASWEKKIGGDGDGIPAKFSLTELGRGRFKVKE